MAARAISRPGKAKRIDLKATHPELYRAKRSVEEIRVPKGTFLAVDGVGAPGGPAFDSAILTLFSVTYTLKFDLKKTGVLDFAVPNLECLWPDDPKTKPQSSWRWRLMIRVPDRVTSSHVAATRRILAGRKGLDASRVVRMTWTEGRALQLLHVGPYDELTESYVALCRAANDRRLVPTGPGHEVYLSDPRRTPAAKLKTIVRMPVRSAARAAKR